MIGAGDTYRAGAIEQIAVHAERIGIKIIQHQEGADPSAVLFDTVQYARSRTKLMWCLRILPEGSITSQT